MGVNDQKSGPSEATAAAKSTPDVENTDQEKKEIESSRKDFMAQLGGGIAKDLEKGMHAYGSFLIALKKLGAVDILDLIKKGFSSFQIEAELKKQVTAALIPSSQISTLRTDEDEMRNARPGEKVGNYIIRCLGLQVPFSKIPKGDDGKENDPTKTSMMLLKLSGVKYGQAYDSIKEKLQANPNTKKPFLYMNDLVYMQTGEKTYTAGFIKDFDIEKDEITLSTVENGAHVIKPFKMKQMFMAFHLNGNTKIMNKSLDNLKSDEKNEDTKPDKPGTSPKSDSSKPTPPAATT